jgi:Polyketide cyclase / dehydrase and lipid transport
MPGLSRVTCWPKIWLHEHALPWWQFSPHDTWAAYDPTMIRGEGTATVKGVTPDEVFDFVLDPVQYTKADTKMVWVTKIADTPNGMIAREDGKFLGRFPGSVVTRYRWKRPHMIDVTIEHGVPDRLHAWFDIQAVDGGTRVTHVEELDMGHGLVGVLYDLVAAKWFAASVKLEVAEIARLLESGQRGRPMHALSELDRS